MAKFTTSQNNCSSGELSPKLRGRFDLKEYANGLLEMRNFLPYKSGGFVKRPGTRFIKDITSAATLGLYKFKFSRSEVYIIVLSVFDVSNLTYKVYNTSGTLIATDEIVFPNIVVISGDENTFNTIQSGDIVFFTHESGEIPPFVIKRTAINTFESGMYMDELDNKFHTFPYLDSNINEGKQLNPSSHTGAIQVAMEDASAGAVPFFDPVKHVGAYFKLSDAALTGVFHITFFPTYKYTAVTADVANASNGIDYGVDTHGYETGDEVTLTTVSGTIPDGWVSGTKYYIIKVDANEIQLATTLALANAGTEKGIADDGTDWIATLTPGLVTQANATVDIDMTDPAPTTYDWNESAWSDYRGWPSCATLYQQRFIFSGATQNPDLVTCSVVGNLFHMMQAKLTQDATTDVSTTNYFGAVAATDAFSFIPYSTEVNQVRWMVGGDVLYLGTTAAEMTVSPVEGIFGPSNKVVQNQGSTGGDLNAVKVGDFIIFITNDGKRLVQTTFSAESEKLSTAELTTLSDQILFRELSSTDAFKSTRMEKLVWQGSRGILWILLSTGKLVAISLDSGLGIAAWHYHPISGTDVVIRGIVTLPNSNSTFDDLWLLINRTVDGSTAKYLEKMGDDFEHVLLDNTSTDENDYPWYSDSSVRIVQSSHVTVPNSPTTGPADLSHLEGETVHGLADGVYFSGLMADGTANPDRVVTSGVITLDTAAAEIIVGLQYTSRIETMPIEAGSQTGNSQISMSRLDKIILKVFKSLYGEQGNSVDNLYDLEYGTVTANTVYTGNLNVDFDSTSSEEQTIVIQHDKPTPFSGLALIIRGKTQD